MLISHRGKGSPVKPPKKKHCHSGLTNLTNFSVFTFVFTDSNRIPKAGSWGEVGVAKDWDDHNNCALTCDISAKVRNDFRFGQNMDLRARCRKPRNLSLLAKFDFFSKVGISGTKRSYRGVQRKFFSDWTDSEAEKSQFYLWARRISQYVLIFSRKTQFQRPNSRSQLFCWENAKLCPRICSELENLSVICSKRKSEAIKT